MGAQVYTREAFDRGDLTDTQKAAVDQIVKSLGYRDLEHFVDCNGCMSATEFVSDFNFRSVRDFFFGDGWYARVCRFRRNDSNGEMPQ